MRNIGQLCRLIANCFFDRLLKPASEERFCGSIDDGSDQVEYTIARRYLARQFGPLQVAAEIARLRDAAQRLVRTAWAEERIRLLADALLRHGGTLSGEEIFESVMRALRSGRSPCRISPNVPIWFIRGMSVQFKIQPYLFHKPQRSTTKDAQTGYCNLT
jgi:hypothetical protein